MGQLFRKQITRYLYFDPELVTRGQSMHSITK